METKQFHPITKLPVRTMMGGKEKRTEKEKLYQNGAISIFVIE